MGQALYRTYRSKNFDQVIGQEQVTKTLQAAIEKGRISHAYLFTGPRGTGKTSVARILAHEINNLDYTSEQTHLDIIEIDAASNRRIDEIRELRDKVNIIPTNAKYKVYIIDEVHMLTREAFNALLKTLEEPPAHVVFILATTEAHKLPETIVSRTQRYNFKPISKDKVVAHLKTLAKKEKIDIDDRALSLLAEFGEGSMRDTISLLDQVSARGEKINEQTVREHLGLPSAQAVEDLLSAVSTGQSQKIITKLDEMREQAADPATIAKLLAAAIRHNMSSLSNSTQLLKALIEVPASHRPADSLEIALLEAAQTQEAPVQQNTMPAPQNSKQNENKDKEIKESSPEPPAKVTKTDKVDTAVSVSIIDADTWDNVLNNIKKEAASIYTALKLAVPHQDGDILTLAFEFPLHQKKINQAQHKDVVCKVIESVCGQKISLQCIVDKQLVKNSKKTEDVDFYKTPAESTSAPLQAITNIFGNAEVLESK